MARPVPKEAWDSIRRQAGLDQARQWAQESGYDAPEDDAEDGELPAIDSLQPPMYQNLSMPASPLEVAAGQTTGAMPQGGGSLDAMLQSSRKSVADMYDEAAKQLQESYRGPSTNDMLLALGAGLLQPTGSGSFGEAIANGVGAMLPYLKEKHAYQRGLNTELTKLRMGKAHDLSSLEARYITARGKALPARRVSSRQGTGELFWTDTGNPVPPPDRVEFLLRNQSDPRVKAIFDTQYGAGEADYQIATHGGQ